MARHSVYRGFEIWHMRTSVPPTEGDWEFSHVDYDGAEDANDDRLGSGCSVDDCKSQIDAMLDEGGTPPDFAAQTADPMTPEQAHEWFRARWAEMRAEGATWPRYAVDDARNPTMWLCEGWKQRPEREASPHFFVQAED